MIYLDQEKRFSQLVLLQQWGSLCTGPVKTIWNRIQSRGFENTLLCKKKNQDVRTPRVVGLFKYLFHFYSQDHKFVLRRLRYDLITNTYGQKFQKVENDENRFFAITSSKLFKNWFCKGHIFSNNIFHNHCFLYVL